MRKDFTPAQLSLFHASKQLPAGNVRQAIRDVVGHDVELDRLSDEHCKMIEAKVQTIVLPATFIDEDDD